MSDKSAGAYWAANVRIIIISLVVWFACSFGLGIILRPALSGIMARKNSITVGSAIPPSVANPRCDNSRASRPLIEVLRQGA